MLHLFQIKDYIPISTLYIVKRRNWWGGMRVGQGGDVGSDSMGKFI